MMEGLLTLVTQLLALSVRAEMGRAAAASVLSAWSGERPKAAKVEGDLIIGGLFPVHGKGSGDRPCGDLHTGRGIHRVEAMLYALDQINADPDLLPDHKLGALILDTCSTPAFALNQSLDFVRDLMGSDASHYTCPEGRTPVPTETPQPVAGVIGGSYSSVSIQVANLLRLFRIVQISPASTNADLSDKTKFEYFARTVPSDNFQARAMADIAAHFNWTYVSLVFSAGEYGELGAEAFKRSARARNVCIALEEKISRPEDLDRILLRVEEKAKRSNSKGVGARVVVLFTRNDDTKAFLRVAHRRLRPGRPGLAPLTWLASDGWDPQDSTTEGVRPTAERAIVLTLASQRVPDFERHFLALDPGDPHFARNPWMTEFWEREFRCSLSGDTKDRLRCNPNLRLSSTEFSPDNKVQFVIDAVKALARALDMLWRHECGVERGQSLKRRRRDSRPAKDCAALSRINGATLYQTFLLNVSFQELALRQALGLLELGSQKPQSPLARKARPDGAARAGEDRPTLPPPAWRPRGSACPFDQDRVDGRKLFHTLTRYVRFKNTAGKPFHFDTAGDAPAYYRILNYRRLSGKEWGYVEMGTWQAGGLEITDEEVLGLAGNETEDSMSICSAPCELGERKSFLQDAACCWVCIPCQPWEWSANETTCLDCGEGRWPYANRSECYDIADVRLQHMDWGSIYSVAPSVLAALGILLTLQVVVVFVRFNETPVVKASGRELSYVLLGGMLVCYAMTFILLAKPSPVVCGVKRVGVGFGFALLYSAMLVKTNRIFRIFASAQESAARPRWISPLSQCVIAGGLAGAQLLGSLLWLALAPPATRHQFPSRGEVVLVCGVGEEWFLVSLAYDLLLIVASTYYAIRTRTVPENFNEAKFIGFTMYTTCIIWMAFVPIYFGTGSDFQIQTTTLCISISLSATVALFCLYSPKLWIILMEPEKNVRKAGPGKPMLSKSGGAGLPAAGEGTPSVYSPLLSSSAAAPTPSTRLLNNNLNSAQRRQSDHHKVPNADSLHSLTSL